MLACEGGQPHTGPLGTPCIWVAADATAAPPTLGLWQYPDWVEVDAASTGQDPAVLEADGLRPGQLWFSVTSNARGLPPGSTSYPTVRSESVLFPPREVAADLFAILGNLPDPEATPGMTLSHVGIVDGDGLASASGFGYPGLGLAEPDPSGNAGDNLDAAYVRPNGTPAPSGFYFSLDQDSASAHGFVGGDVLVRLLGAGGGPNCILYASAAVLGLDQQEENGDELDALLLLENNTPGYQVSTCPFDWEWPMGQNTDMLVFSVSANSDIIGQLDSIHGLPIEAGDLLVPPRASFCGGLNANPGIFIAASALGLRAVRNGSAGMDDVDALVRVDLPYFDCNSNGVEDAVDVATGSSNDVNKNGIPDECESLTVGTPGCLCTTGRGPCGNDFPTAGCVNSSGAGSDLSGSGSDSVAADDLVLTASSLPAGVPGIFFGGVVPITPPLPFGDGLRCAGGSITRYSSPAVSSGAGTLMVGPGLAGSFGHSAGDFVVFQCWFRDTMGPCGSGFNTSSSLEVTFTP